MSNNSFISMLQNQSNNDSKLLCPPFNNASNNYASKLDFGPSGASSIHLGTNRLSEKEDQYFCELNKSIGDDFIEAHIHRGHNNGDNYSPPHGVTMKFTPNAIANPRLFQDRFGSHILACKIIPRDDVDDSYFKKRMHLLNKIPSEHPNSIDLNTILHKDQNVAEDARPWVATTGGSSSRIQVLKIPGKRGSSVYYLLVMADSGRAGKQLKLFLKKKFLDYQNGSVDTPYTLSDLEQSREYRKTIDLGKRNCQRLLTISSQLLGVQLDGKAYEDPLAVTSEETHAVPLLTDPFIENKMNVLVLQKEKDNSDLNSLLLQKPSIGSSIKESDLGVGPGYRKLAVIHSFTCPTNDCKGGLVFISDPTLDARIYHVPISRNNLGKSGYNNPYSSSFSPFTAKSKKSNIDGNKLNPTLKKYINNSITWDGKQAQDATHPSLVGAYNELSELNEGINKNVLGAKYGHIDVSPVIAKINSPK